MRWRQHASRNREVHVHSGLARSELSQHGPCCHAYESWFLTGTQLPVVICGLSNTGSFPPYSLHQWSYYCGRQCLAPIYFHQFSAICWHFAWCVVLSKVKYEGPMMTVHAPVTFTITLSIPQSIDSAPPCGIRPSFANIQCHQPCTRWDLMIIRPWHWSGNLVGGQAYYPERLAKAFVVHVPTVFWGVWHMLSPFIDKVTREKVGFLFMPNK
jgi:hypothetical protein